MQELTKYIQQLNELDDEDKIGYLVDLQRNEKLPDEFEIQIDNDNVYIFFGYEDDEPIGCSFNEFGYHLLPAIFNFIGLKSDFV